jgi:hypothetical protein
VRFRAASAATKQPVQWLAQPAAPAVITDVRFQRIFPSFVTFWALMIYVTVSGDTSAGNPLLAEGLVFTKHEPASGW